MTGMESQGGGRKASLVDRLKDYLEFAAALIGISSAILGMFWIVARNEVKDGVRAFIGVPELALKIERVGDIAETNAEAIRKMLPPMRVAEYDVLRSRIFSPCSVGRSCEFTIRARRTEDGKECATPEVLGRIVVDRAGLQYTVDSATTRAPSRIDGEWRSISSAFIVPDSAPAGVAEFYMVLGYDCGGRSVEQETVRMVFEIIPEAAP